MSDPESRNGNGNIELGNTYKPSAQSTSVGRLPYRISDHKVGWIKWFSLWFFDSCILTLALFYGLWYHTHLSHYVIFAIITSLWGWTAYTQWTKRLFRLLKKDPKYRPLGATNRWWLDLSMYTSSVAIGLVALELVIATSFNNPPVRLLAMPGPSLLYVIGLYMLLQNTLHVTGCRALVALSSTHKGVQVRPPWFTVMEDVFAVDGGEGVRGREAMWKLYDESAEFRRTLVRMSWVWGVLCTLVAVALSIVVGCTTEIVGFGVAWGISFPFILIMALATIYWTEHADAQGAFVAKVDGYGEGKA